MFSLFSKTPASFHQTHDPHISFVPPDQLLTRTLSGLSAAFGLTSFAVYALVFKVPLIEIRFKADRILKQAGYNVDQFRASLAKKT